MNLKRNQVENSTASVVFSELIEYFLSKYNTMEYAMQVKHAEILQEIPKSPKEIREFPSGVGTFPLIVSILVSELCGGIKAGRIEPILIIVDDWDKHRKILGEVNRISNALIKIGMLEHSLMIRISKPLSVYLCPRRASDIMRLDKSDVQNKREMAAYVKELGDVLEIGNCSKEISAKICVDTCHRACGHRSNCRYAKHVRNLKQGHIPIQIYSSGYYLRELQRMAEGRESSLPLHKYVIFDEDTYPDDSLCLPSEVSYRERRINAFLNDCVMQFTGTKQHKGVTRHLAQQIRKISDDIFSMPNTISEKEGAALNAAQQAIGPLVQLIHRLGEVRKADFCVHPQLGKELKEMISIFTFFSSHIDTIRIEYIPKVGKVIIGTSPHGNARTKQPYKHLDWLPSCQEFHIYSLITDSNETC